MTLQSMKKKVLSLIEEINPSSQYLTDDVDIQAKINYVINQIQNELARIKKIPELTTIAVEEGDEMLLTDIDPLLYQLNIIRGVDYDILADYVIFNETGDATVFYYKYPVEITASTLDTYVFELSSDVLEVMPYGIAGDLLKSDVSSEYGKVYSDRYETMLRRIDPRYGTGSVYIEGIDLEWQ